GNTFQTMLRNPLASPDVIGITSGASTAAVFCILVLGWGPSQASPVAIAASLLLAAAIYGLSTIRGFSSGKLILVGLGVQALTKALTSYLLLKAAAYDVPAALRWLSGSLNGVALNDVPLLVLVIPLAVVVVCLGRRLRVLELGDETATMLGVRPNVTRAALIVCSVVMIALGTAVTGPIACVTFLAGPIATRLLGQQGSASIPAGLVGVILVLAADVIGQNFLGTRFPVGVVTGLLGTPYLLYLLVSMNKKGSM
ncbi:MAG: iron ABC transporter permease, partial [Coriobacteriia bacterium]|nr:iron ABC transporter permease [Coriobacteriia bacterium]